jgi:hypothetical protein
MSVSSMSLNTIFTYPLYTGVFLNLESKLALLNQNELQPKYNKKFGHHIIINFNPGQSLDIKWGALVELQIVKHIYDNYCQIIEVVPVLMKYKVNDSSKTISNLDEIKNELGIKEEDKHKRFYITISTQGVDQNGNKITHLYSERLLSYLDNYDEQNENQQNENEQDENEQDENEQNENEQDENQQNENEQNENEQDENEQNENEQDENEQNENEQNENEQNENQQNENQQDEDEQNEGVQWSSEVDNDYDEQNNNVSIIDLEHKNYYLRGFCGMIGNCITERKSNNFINRLYNQNNSNRGNYRGNNNRGNYRGINNRGNYRGNNNRGNYRGNSSRSNYRGNNRGDYWENYRENNRGNNRGTNRISIYNNKN